MSRREPGVAATVTLLGFGLAVVAVALGATLFLVGVVFGEPAWLHLAWLAPALIVLDAWARVRRRGRLARLGPDAAVATLIQRRLPALRTVRTFLAASAMLFLAVAAARPQWGMAEQEIRRRGVDVVICIDTSKSMLARDVKPSRLARAKLGVASLIDRLGGDRVALVAFSGDARVICPLTLDHGTAKLFLDLIEPDLLQRPGTAIGRALEAARDAFPETTGRHSVVVLLTDGEDHEGRAEDVADELADLGVVVHVVGIGDPEGVPIPVDDEGRGDDVSFLRDENGDIVMSRLGVDTLRTLTDATGGVFSRISPSELELTTIASEIAGMEQQDFGAKRTLLRTDRPAWFLVPALVLLALEALLPDGASPWRSRSSRTSRLAATRERAAGGRAA